MAQIADGKVVFIHYTLSDSTGEEQDSSRTGTGEPLGYVHGQGHIVPGLEKQLLGKAAGDTLKAVVPPEEAYGPRDPDATQTVPKDRFPADAKLTVGLEFLAEAEDGTEVPLRVTAVNDDSVTVDCNHPLAGETLHFDVEVMDVRDPTAEELKTLAEG